MVQQLGKAMLVIDGAYLTVGSNNFLKDNKRTLVEYSNRFNNPFKYFSKKVEEAGLRFHPDLKHFVTAEHNEETKQRHDYYYDECKKNGVQVDISDFKYKKIINSDGTHTIVPFQRGCDVKIAGKVYRAAY